MALKGAHLAVTLGGMKSLLRRAGALPDFFAIVNSSETVAPTVSTLNQVCLKVKKIFKLMPCCRAMHKSISLDNEARRS
jgi:hypothetical protein